MQALVSHSKLGARSSVDFVWLDDDACDVGANGGFEIGISDESDESKSRERAAEARGDVLERDPTREEPDECEDDDGSIVGNGIFARGGGVVSAKSHIATSTDSEPIAKNWER